MRLFVAVFPPDDVCRDLRERLTEATDPAGRPRRGRQPVRLTAVDRWHVTLAFLGEVPDERTAEVERVLSAVTVPKALDLRLRGGGQFGMGRSTVLWAAVDGNLGQLRAEIHEQLEAAGLPHDERPFTPHLTVAYAQDDAVREALAGYRGPRWTVHEIALVRSDPHEGYTLLRTW